MCLRRHKYWRLYRAVLGYVTKTEEGNINIKLARRVGKHHPPHRSAWLDCSWLFRQGQNWSSVGEKTVGKKINESVESAECTGNDFKTLLTLTFMCGQCLSYWSHAWCISSQWATSSARGLNVSCRHRQQTAIASSVLCDSSITNHSVLPSKQRLLPTSGRAHTY